MKKNENGSGDSIPLNPFKIPAHNDILKLRDEERCANHAKCWIFEIFLFFIRTVTIYIVIQLSLYTRTSIDDLTTIYSAYFRANSAQEYHLKIRTKSDKRSAVN